MSKAWRSRTGASSKFSSHGPADGRKRRCTSATSITWTSSAPAVQDTATFSAASIKRSTSGLPYSQSADRPDGLAMVNERLRDVILFAFGLHDFQLTGDPAWVSRDQFDISARADAP